MFEDNYTLGEKLGEGAYATVYRCVHKSTGAPFAVKIIDKSKAGPKDISDINHEVNMMQAVKGHPHVIQYTEFFDTSKNIFLVLELVQGGMLFDRIIKLKHYSEKHASILVRKFLQALEHVHSKGIMHRDLKPENLLLKREGEDEVSLTDVALADFGLAAPSPGQTCCGSPSYIAPEVINVGYLRTRREPYDTKCDIWSLGTITYILLSGKMPFHGRNFKETFSKIVKGQWSFAGDVWNHVSADAKDFTKLVLTLDPAARPSAKDALSHPWMRNAQSDAHVPERLDELKRLRAAEKLRGAVHAFRAMSTLLGSLDRTPPFLKYLRISEKEKLGTTITCQSQTDPTKTHVVNYAHALQRNVSGWQLQDCCTCKSALVCRHIQNVHEYLCVGKRSMDIEPFINEIHVVISELQFDFADDDENADNRGRLELAEYALKAINAFHAAYCGARESTPDVFKSNLMLESSPSGGAKAAVGKFLAHRERH